MFLISATFNICNYEDIMKRYDSKVALPVVELLGDDVESVFFGVCVCVFQPYVQDVPAVDYILKYLNVLKTKHRLGFFQTFYKSFVFFLLNY